MSSFFGKVKDSVTGGVTKSVRYMLTDRGEERLTGTMHTGSREFQVLHAVKDLQPHGTARDIARSLGWKTEGAEGALRLLESEDLVEKVE
jgi:DNA-binding MarR family transcriptional regulator